MAAIGSEIHRDTSEHTHRLRSGTGFQWLLFLTIWFAYGITINSGNLLSFGLQQAGIEAYVERHHLYLEGSQVEQLQVQPVVDAFLYNGHIYPAKQPGQFMVGAIAYFPLHSIGLTYGKHYLLTAALVTLLTGSLFTAVSSLVVFRIALLLQAGVSLFWPLVCALTYAFGTTAFAYSGIAWHDSIATACLMIAFYILLTVSNRPKKDRKSKIMAAVAGLSLALTLVTSMLPLLMVVVLVAYFFTLRRRQLVIPFFIGGLVGLTPLLLYNFLCFGNPFLLPNVAGDYRDTFFRLNPSDFIEKLRFYIRVLTNYVPVFWLGIVGLLLFPRKLWKAQATIAVIMLALAAYILNIDANGTCQYGPRYLLPAMPFACLGLLGFSFLRGPSLRRVAAAVVVVAATASLVINLVGAMHGAMLCYFPDFAVGLYLSQMLNGQMRSFPLAPWIMAPFVLCLFLLVRELTRRRATTRQVNEG